MRFIDEAIIIVRSGRGGRGVVSFHREKFVAKGGPDGGDGGRGGDAVLEATLGMRTLLDFHYKRKYQAEDGAPGQSSNKTGKSGKDLVLKIPVGTMVFDESGELLTDLTSDGQQWIAAKGGHPGLGNVRFVKPWKQAPDIATDGGEGVELTLRFELKLLADVGLVGLPNAGKSTLVNRISRSHAQVADYPFTTIVPNLGVVEMDDRSFVVGDMPGLIEGAAGGVGLGLQFLRHCERTSLLAHLVDLSPGGDIEKDLETVEKELFAYSAELLKRPRILIGTKTDIPGHEEGLETLMDLAQKRHIRAYAISSHTGDGIKDVIVAMAKVVLSDEKHGHTPH